MRKQIIIWILFYWEYWKKLKNLKTQPSSCSNAEIECSPVPQNSRICSSCCESHTGNSTWLLTWWAFPSFWATGRTWTHRRPWRLGIWLLASHPRRGLNDRIRQWEPRHFRRWRSYHRLLERSKWFFYCSSWVELSRTFSRQSWAAWPRRQPSQQRCQRREMRPGKAFST